ncbi:MAG: phytoene/squalene synthase family protein [Flavobacteriaceae bacterium TMED42]|nr:phytoene/squalene synthase family protein [Flavobacteriaceae bacterium]OUX36788.1 MAG: phytoene synthase [Kiritimatiellaceae bacterium TMED266]RPG63285.1 MAG: phytoene/squalene synthase family protein [Flavobacteriaceae bacterium TMED42]MDB2520765.1 phytoene/squalene synthase family protein [Flavobacteriaceae bacterium]MDC0479273.1 phytoene/squalene synthase family protein [Flavobacteriaceae bacterium]
MKNHFDSVSYECSKLVTQRYSTSFTLGTRMLAAKHRKHIYNLYGFVRFADEIVDSFHNFDKKDLLKRFEEDLRHALDSKISLNPILNSFQYTVHQNNIHQELIDAFLKSMNMDLHKQKYNSKEEYQEYIYGSADVVGLMCLNVFLEGDNDGYKQLKPQAMALGSAFQKVNFLRDLNADFKELDRTYFPNLDLSDFNEKSKASIIEEIEKDFDLALEGIFMLPESARLGVYTAYKYYRKLLVKLKNTPSRKIQSARIRVPNYQKMGVLAQSYLKFHLNLL